MTTRSYIKAYILYRICCRLGTKRRWWRSCIDPLPVSRTNVNPRMPRSVSWWSGATIEEAPWHRVRFRICADAFHSEADRRSLVTEGFVQKGERLQSGSTGRRTRIPDFAGRRTRTRIMLRAKMILLTIKMTRPLRRVDSSRTARRRRGKKILFWE